MNEYHLFLSNKKTSVCETFINNFAIAFFLERIFCYWISSPHFVNGMLLSAEAGATLGWFPSNFCGGPLSLLNHFRPLFLFFLFDKTFSSF